jgi:hypothetical protein
MSTTTRTGPKELPPEIRREQKLVFAANAGERARVDAAAKLAGVSRGEWLRTTALTAARETA